MCPARENSALEESPSGSSLTALVLDLHVKTTLQLGKRSDQSMSELTTLIAAALRVIPLLEQQHRARTPRMKEAQDMALRHLSTAQRHSEHARRDCESCSAAFELARRNLLHALETLLAVLAPYSMTGLVR